MVVENVPEWVKNGVVQCFDSDSPELRADKMSWVMGFKDQLGPNRKNSLINIIKIYSELDSRGPVG